jgi:hypothetical protein
MAMQYRLCALDIWIQNLDFKLATALSLIFVCNRWGGTSTFVLPFDGAVMGCFFDFKLQLVADSV